MSKLKVVLVVVISVFLLNDDGYCFAHCSASGISYCTVDYCTVEFDTCFWSFQDCDRDGIPSERTLQIKLTKQLIPRSNYFEIWSFSESDSTELVDTGEIYGDQMELSEDVPWSASDETFVVVKVKSVESDDVIDTYSLPGINDYESENDDIAVNLYDIQLSEVDVDGDSYCRSRTLSMITRACSLGNVVYVKTSVCKYPISDEPCWYHISDDFWSNGAHSILIGGENGELDSGLYRIAVQAFDSETGDPQSDYLNVFDSVKFEKASEDILPQIKFSFADFYFDAEKVDLDNDGYWSRRKMYFDVDADTGTYSLVAKIGVKESSSDVYNDYLSTAPFSVTGIYKDYQEVTIGLGGMIFNPGTYDFKIEIYLGSTKVAEIDPDDYPELGSQNVESEFDDPPLGIKQVEWIELRDCDNDGEPVYGRLKVDLEVYNVVDSIYIGIEGYCGEDTEEMALSDTLQLVSDDTSIYIEVTRQTICDAMSVSAYIRYTGRYFNLTVFDFRPDQYFVFEESEDNFCDTPVISKDLFISEFIDPVKVYPNPVSNSLVVIINPIFIGDIQSFEFFDGLGKRVDIKKMSINENLFEYNTRELKAGLYFMLVRFSNRISVFKILKN